MKKRYQYYQIRRVPKKGMGVITQRTFLPSDVVVVGRIIRRVTRRTRYSFQVDWDTHVDLDEPARSLNHSCHPNLGVQKNQFGGYNFVAMHSIKPGEELCCEAKQCRKAITGYQGLPESLKVKYQGFIAPYLVESRKR